jgi:hypothetical protein
LHNWIRTKGAAYAHFKSLILHNRITDSTEDQFEEVSDNNTSDEAAKQGALLQLLANENLSSEQDFYLQV